MPTLYPPSWILEFSPRLHQNLTNNSLWIEANKPELLPKLEELFSTLTTWSQLSREDLLVDLLHQLFGYVSLTVIYDLPVDINISAYNLFKIEDSLLFEEDYFDSLQKIDEVLQAIPSTITAEIHSAMDTQNSIASVVKRVSLDIMMGSISAKNPINKKDIMRRIFIDNNYSNIYRSLNIGTLLLPTDIL